MLELAELRGKLDQLCEARAYEGRDQQKLKSASDDTKRDRVRWDRDALTPLNEPMLSSPR